MRIRIDWPEKNDSEVYTIERILDVYTPEEIENGFLGNLDGDAQFILQCDKGHPIGIGQDIPNAIKPYLQEWDKRTIRQALALSNSY